MLCAFAILVGFDYAPLRTPVLKLFSAAIVLVSGSWTCFGGKKDRAVSTDVVRGCEPVQGVKQLTAGN